ncbi:MAG: type IX secretion system membrane protein PorP/SprF [Flavobacterium sp.]|nr:type IX secretion system membrane protein PorP/SprF [Flavobacterium sp.]
MKKTILFVIFFFFAKSVSAQQDPEYTHYMYNMNAVNPAYATGTTDVLNLGTLYRTQWVGAVGAPKTLTFFGHIPVNKKIEMGVSLISDDIGDGAKKENNFYADFAYVLQLKNRHSLSFGLKAGFTSLQTNFNGFRFESGDPASDLAFAENINMFKPNIGAGVYYFTNHYYIGLSAPNLLSSKHIEERNGINAYGSESIHTFLTAGYVFNINADFKLKPAFMSKFVTGAPMAIDLTANVLYRNKFELGVAYRLNDAVSGLMNINVTDNLRIGYAYDYTLSNLGQFNSGTHEIMILFDLDLMGKGYDKSPRFF